MEPKSERQAILQEKSLQLMLLDQELRKIEEQYKFIDQNIANIELTKINLDEVKNLKEEKDILASLAEGIFIKAKAEKGDKVLINVGKGVVLEKSIDEAKQILNAKIDELSMLKTILSSEAQKLLNEIKSIEEEVRELTGQKII